MGKLKALLDIFQKNRASLLDVVVFGTLTFTAYILLSDIAMSSKKKFIGSFASFTVAYFCKSENLTVSAVVVMVLDSQDKVNMKRWLKIAFQDVSQVFAFVP